MITAEAAVLGVVMAGRLAHVLRRQAHFQMWKDAAPMSSIARGMLREHLLLERLGAVRADGHVAQPGWWAVPHTHLHAQLQAVRA